MQDYRSRLVIATIVLIQAFLILGGRLWYLQIFKGAEYEKFSRDNRISIERVPAPRGRILDREGRELVVNRSSFDVYVLPKEVSDPDQVAASLAPVLNVEPKTIKKQILDAGKKDRFQTHRIAQDINRDQLAYIEARKSSLKGVQILVNSIRQYPYGNLGAQIIGYLGKVSPQDLRANPGMSGSDFVGKSGVEKGWETYLRGDDGYIQSVTDALGREVESALFQKDLIKKNSLPGNDVVLTIDINLQRAAEEALGTQNGSIVVVNVNNGNVLALASKPTFTPEEFINGIKKEKWDKLLKDKSYPLVNRSTQGLYAPGSVFKIVPAAAALKEELVTTDTYIHCPGYHKVAEHTFRCWKRSGHGWMNLHDAMVESCDVYFYKVAEKLGIDRLHRYMKGFGFGEYTGIGIEERKGLAPSREWKKQKLNKPWYKGETVVSSIGQGYVNVTPLQVTMMTAAVANGGVLLKPSIVKRVVDYKSENKVEYSAKANKYIPVGSEITQTLRDALTGAVNDPGATGRRAWLPHVKVAGKTGTAQVISLDTKSNVNRHRDHAWFTSYAPAQEPDIAVTVIVENGGKGGEVAAPIARDIIKFYMKLKREGYFDDNV